MTGIKPLYNLSEGNRAMPDSSALTAPQTGPKSLFRQALWLIFANLTIRTRYFGA
jgi:hypothetical protein